LKKKQISEYKRKKLEAEEMLANADLEDYDDIDYGRGGLGGGRVSGGDYYESSNDMVSYGPPGDRNSSVKKAAQAIGK